MGEGVHHAGLDGASALLLLLSFGLVDGRHNAIGMPRVRVDVGGCARRVAEDLADFLLLEVLAIAVAVVAFIAAAGKHHLLDEVSDALAVRIVEYPADHALEEGLILELQLFLAIMPVLALGWVWGEAIVLVLGFGLPSDEAADVGR